METQTLCPACGRLVEIHSDPAGSFIEVHTVDGSCCEASAQLAEPETIQHQYTLAKAG